MSNTTLDSATPMTAALHTTMMDSETMDTAILNPASLDTATLQQLIVPVQGYDDLHRHQLCGELERFRKSLEWVEPRSGGKLLDVGARGDLVPVYKRVLGYEAVACVDGVSLGGLRRLVHEDGSVDEFDSYRADLERDPLPFDDETFDQAVAMEVIEHLAIDPMFLLAEINRVLKPGGTLLLTTPNITSLASLYLLVWGRHPAIGGQTYGPGIMDRHHREYTPSEIRTVLAAAGFEVRNLDTFDPMPPSQSARKAGKLLRVLRRFKPGINVEDRGRVIRCRCVKVGGVEERFPEVIYPRYAFYDYAAYDHELTKRFGGRRYWRSSAVPCHSSDAASPA